MVVCGKRRSIKAIAENASGKKGDKKEREVEEKPKVNEKKKKIDNAFVSVEEKGVIKKKVQEKSSVSGRRNSRSSSNKSGEAKHQYGGNELSSHDALEVKTESKKETDAKKKQGVASFLKRMKQNSPSEELENDDEDADTINNNNIDADDDDDSEKESKDNKVEEEKKRKSRSKRDVKRERVTRSSRGRGVREESGRVKKGMGRPKRLETTTTMGKRGRDDGESEVGGGGGRGGGGGGEGRSKKKTRR